MAGHGLGGTHSQAVRGCLGQVVQQAETHVGYVPLAGHTVLQIVSAAGKLAERHRDCSSARNGEMTDDVIMSKTEFGKCVNKKLFMDLTLVKKTTLITVF